MDSSYYRTLLLDSNDHISVAKFIVFLSVPNQLHYST